MLGNWSVILNIVLLLGVVAAIIQTVRVRREKLRMSYARPSIGTQEVPLCDDIIAVRKVSRDDLDEAPIISPLKQKSRAVAADQVKPIEQPEPRVNPAPEVEPTQSVMMFLLAKEDRQLAGYELLQTLLAAGLRFGEGHLFHRHQNVNGQGPVLCSVAAATSSGMFDLQNIGAFSVHGLCIFMEASGNAAIDGERFDIMLDTAKQLSEDLDTHLLDDRRQPLTDDALARYYRMLGLAVTNELELHE